MSKSYLQQERHGDLLILRLQRSACGNAVNRPLLEELIIALDGIAADNSVKGVLLGAVGADFSIGYDLAEVRDLDPLGATALAEVGQRLCQRLHSLPKPVLAVVQGRCYGAGFELALACDFILADETVCFAFPEIRFGIIPGFGATARLPRRIGKSKAKELIFTGRDVLAEEALDIGLVSRLCRTGELAGDALALLSQICRQSPSALRLGKEVINAGADINLPAACLLERDAFAVCFATDDQKEGMGAFVEKRRPDFKG